MITPVKVITSPHQPVLFISLRLSMVDYYCHSWDKLIIFSQKTSAENYQITTKKKCCPPCYVLPETTNITKLRENFLFLK